MNPSLDECRRTLEELAAALAASDPAATAFVLWSGHAATAAGSGDVLLVPGDATDPRDGRQCIALCDVVTAMSGADGTVRASSDALNVLVVDCACDAATSPLSFDQLCLSASLFPATQSVATVVEARPFSAASAGDSAHSADDGGAPTGLVSSALPGLLSAPGADLGVALSRLRGVAAAHGAAARGRVAVTDRLAARFRLHAGA